MPIQTPAEMAEVHPLDIRDQAHFDELLRAVPRPVPQEWRIQYNRLNAIARRHGFVWPYRIRIASPKAAVPRREMPVAPEGATRGGSGGIHVAVPLTQSAEHIANKDGHEYFWENGYIMFAPLDNPIDQEEHCRKGGQIACEYGEIRTLYEELTGKKLPW